MASTGKPSKGKTTSSKGRARIPGKTAFDTPASIAAKHSGSAVMRKDSWLNSLTGFGVPGADKRKSTEYGTSPILDEGQLRDMYRGDGFVKRIVELPTREMMRRGFEIKGDEDRKVASIFEERGIHKKVTDMIRWARLYGGCLGVMGLQDGGKLDTPLNEGKIKSLDFLHVFDRYRVTWTSADLYSDPMNPKYGLPQFYRVSPIIAGAAPFRVHESRTLRLDGLPVPDFSRIENHGWGDSVIQCAFEQVRALGAVYGGTELIVDDFITGVLGIKNLADQLAAGNKAFLKDRIDSMDLSKHILNTTVIDADFETFEKKASSVAGLPDIIDRFAMALSAVTGIPQTLLMGRSPAGMNSTGEGDIRNWYDQVAQDQGDLLNPIYERLVRLVFISKEGGGQEPEDWEIDWNPLWEPTESEDATTKKTEAEEKDLYVQMGAMDPDEVRETIRDRFKLEGDVKAPEPEPTPTDPGTTGSKPPKGLPPADPPAKPPVKGEAV